MLGNYNNIEMGCTNSKEIIAQDNKSDRKFKYSDNEKIDLVKLCEHIHMKNTGECKPTDYSTYQADVELPALRDGEDEHTFDLSRYHIPGNTTEEKVYKVPKIAYPKLDLNIQALKR